MILFHCCIFIYQVAKSIGILNRLKRYMPPNILRTLYSALILPHFTFFIELGFQSKQNKASKNAGPCPMSNQREWKYRDGPQRGSIKLMWPVCEDPSVSVNTMFKIDLVIIIPHNGTFPDIGEKPPFSVILWPLGGLNLVNMAHKRINSEHSPKQCTH